MNSNKDKTNKFMDFFAWNGFYIVLFLCIAAICVSAYILFFADKPDEEALTPNDITELTLGPESLDDPIVVIDPNEALAPVMAASEGDLAEAQKPVLKPTPEPTPTPASKTPASASAVYVWPLNGEVIAGFSVDELVKSKTMGDWRTHNGIDISASEGAKVAAISDGTVEDIYNDELMGTTILIDHGNNIKSLYSNLMPEVTVTKGKTVSAGDTIAGVGDSAMIESGEVPHVHLEVIKSGGLIDPLTLLPKR